MRGWKSMEGGAGGCQLNSICGTTEVTQPTLHVTADLFYRVSCRITTDEYRLNELFPGEFIWSKGRVLRLTTVWQ